MSRGRLTGLDSFGKEENLPGQSLGAEGGEGGGEAGDVADTEAGSAFADAVEQPREDAPGTEFEEKVAFEVVDEVLDGLGPADGSGDLILERLADFLGGGNWGGVDVTDYGKVWGADAGALQFIAELEISGVHEARVVGACYVEEFCHADAVFFGQGNGETDFRSFSRDDHLAGAVEVGDIDIGFSGESTDGAFFAPDHRGHASAGFGAGFFHKESAFGH